MKDEPLYLLLLVFLGWFFHNFCTIAKNTCNLYVFYKQQIIYWGDLVRSYYNTTKNQVIDVRNRKSVLTQLTGWDGDKQYFFGFVIFIFTYWGGRSAVIE